MHVWTVWTYLYGLNVFWNAAIFPMPGEYPAFVYGAIGRVLEMPGLSVSGDSNGNRGSQVLAVRSSLAELAWINLPIICVRADIWAWRGSGFDLILSSIRSGDSSSWFHHFGRLRPLLMQWSIVLRERKFLDAFESRKYYHSSVFYTWKKNSCNRWRG